MRTFEAFGRRLEYVPALGERTIEIPMSLAALKCFRPEQTVEVGSVLPTNLNVIPGGKVTHRIIDRFDPNYDHTDACTVDYTGLDVLSISTLEHFDVGDHDNPDVGGKKGPECLEKILKEARRYFITLPLGYNKPMDDYVQHSGHQVWCFHETSGPTNQSPNTPPEWQEVQPVLWGSAYATPFHYANTLVVLTNVPWMVDGTGHIGTIISDCFNAADQETTKAKIMPEVFAVESQTGPKTRMFLNALLGCVQQPVYLEIGLRYGGSFLSALSGNQVRVAYGIDRDNPEGYVSIRDALVKNNRLLDREPNTSGRRILHLEGCWQFEPDRITEPVNVFFYDGPHDQADHRKALVHYAPCLAKDFIYIVDDWNEMKVKDGTKEGIEATAMEVMYEEERSGGENMVDKYYNGLWVAHLRKP